MLLWNGCRLVWTWFTWFSMSVVTVRLQRNSSFSQPYVVDIQQVLGVDPAVTEATDGRERSSVMQDQPSRCLSLHAFRAFINQLTITEGRASRQHNTWPQIKYLWLTQGGRGHANQMVPSARLHARHKRPERPFQGNRVRGERTVNTTQEFSREHEADRVKNWQV